MNVVVTKQQQTPMDATPFVPKSRSLRTLAQAVQDCEGCPLYKNATQAVFGEGPKHAKILMVGEQPGDQEDLAGKPFVGPAGRVLAEAMDAVGIPRDQVFVSNAVKHFKFEARGKRRIHSKPTYREVQACRPWLEKELEIVKPALLVLLGSTAAQSFMGSGFRITKHRGEPFETEWCDWTLATVHPSSVLRQRDDESRRAARQEFIADFEVIAERWRKAK